MLLLLLLISFSRQSNFCTKGIDTSHLSPKDYLLSFSKGFCSPVLIVPALTAVKLSVEINCEELRDQNSEIFKTCGFTHCKKEFWEFWKSVPETEYPLWFGKFFTPVSLFTTSTRVSNCFAAFMNVKVDFTKPPEESLLEQPGFRIKIYGQTKKTRANS